MSTEAAVLGSKRISRLIIDSNRETNCRRRPFCLCLSPCPPDRNSGIFSGLRLFRSRFLEFSPHGSHSANSGLRARPCCSERHGSVALCSLRWMCLLCSRPPRCLWPRLISRPDLQMSIYIGTITQVLSTSISK